MESRPVFADPSGRRHQVLRFAGIASMAVLATFMVAVIVAMTGGPQAPLTQWAGPQTPPSSGARHGSQAVTGGSKPSASSGTSGSSQAGGNGTSPAGVAGATPGKSASPAPSTSPSPQPSHGGPKATSTPSPTVTHGKSEATPHPTPSHK